MMEWALVLIFAIAALLLIFSALNTRKVKITEQREMDMLYISLMENIHKLEKQISDIELDGLITAKEAGVPLSSKEREFLREILDLYKKGYSIESIAAKKQMKEKEIADLLAPYMKVQSERRKVANDS